MFEHKHQDVERGGSQEAATVVDQPAWESNRASGENVQFEARHAFVWLGPIVQLRRDVWEAQGFITGEEEETKEEKEQKMFRHEDAIAKQRISAILNRTT